MYTTGTATDYQDLLGDLRTWLTGTAGWTELAWVPPTLDAKSVDSIVNAGSGYAVNDTITLAGGTSTTATVLTVTGVTGGAIDTVSLTTAGVYTVAPSDPVAQGSTSGSGINATFNMTYGTMMNSVAELQLEGPGNGADARVYVNIATEYDIGNAMYSWALYGATGYTARIDLTLQPGAGGPAYLNLWQNSISYWFFANDRRFIVVAKCSTNYMSAYCGFILPFALPSEYPFPLAIIGSYPEMNVCDVANARNSSIADPGADGAAWYRRRTTEVWAQIENQANSTSAVSPVTGERAFMWPHKTGRNAASGSTSDPNAWSSAGFNVMKLNALDEAPLIQCHIVDMSDNTVVGALDGVYSTTGFNRSTEQEVVSGSITYLLFQRAFRNQPGDFFAVEEA